MHYTLTHLFSFQYVDDHDIEKIMEPLAKLRNINGRCRDEGARENGRLFPSVVANLTMKILGT